MAFEYAYYLGILRDLIPDLKLIEARAVGGGARSQVWNQIKSDVLGVPYQTLKRAEFGTWGCAMIAGRAVGIFHDLAEIATLSTAPSGAPQQPRLEVHSAYQPYVGQYIGWQKVFSESFRSLAGN
jgi:xylulokinase